MGTLLRRAVMPVLTLALAGLCPADVLTVGGTVTGALASDDARSDQGKCEDQHTLTLAAGQGAVVTLVSEDFDCYLRVTGPDGTVMEDDDSAGDLDSRVMLMPGAGGSSAVTVTSYSPEEMGAYTLTASPVQGAALLPNQLQRGMLLEGPVVYQLPVTPGQALMVFASSEQFDTTLAVEGPDGLRLFNDDIHGMLNSGLLYTPGAEGTAAIILDAYSSGSSGEYEIIATDLMPMHHFDYAPESETRELVRMPLPQLGAALFELAGAAGTQVRVNVSSESFDTVVYAFGPEGEIGSDDDGGEGTNSRLIVTMPETGLARLIVAPFQLGTDGSFEISVDTPTPEDLSEDREEFDMQPVEQPTGQPLPAFTARDLEGNTVNSSEFDGAVRIIDVWATWCPPCRMEIPHFIELTNRYPDLRVVGISVDDGPEVVRQFVQENGVNYTMLMDDGTTVNALATATAEGSINAIPTTFVVGRDGRVAAIHVGYSDLAAFEAEIQPLLAQ